MRSEYGFSLYSFFSWLLPPFFHLPFLLLLHFPYCLTYGLSSLLLYLGAIFVLATHAWLPSISGFSHSLFWYGEPDSIQVIALYIGLFSQRTMMCPSLMKWASRRDCPLYRAFLTWVRWNRKRGEHVIALYIGLFSRYNKDGYNKWLPSISGCSHNSIFRYFLFNLITSDGYIQAFWQKKWVNRLKNPPRKCPVFGIFLILPI